MADFYDGRLKNMANVQKYKAPSMGHMFAHYERRKNEQGEYIKYGNQSIDTTRTHLNYNLAENHNQLDFVRKRLEEVHHTNRNDINVFATWVVTAPKDLSKEQEKDFFKTSYDFLCKRYGKENCISAYVHNDETTPHLHFCFIPIAKNSKFRGKIVDKLSAKEVLTKADLKTFHKELQEAMDKNNIRCSIENGITAVNGNKTVDELKKELAQQNSEIAITTEKLNAANEKATKIKNELYNIIQDNLNNEQKIASVKKLGKDFEDYFRPIPLVGGYKVNDSDYKKAIKIFKQVSLLGNEFGTKNSEVNKKLQELEEKTIKLQKKEQDLNQKEHNLLNRNSLLSVKELENNELKEKQLMYRSTISEIVELLGRMFNGDIPVELKKVLLKAFQKVGLKPTTSLKVDEPEKNITKKDIERKNNFER